MHEIEIQGLSKPCKWHKMGERMRVRIYLNTLDEGSLGQYDAAGKLIDSGMSWIYGACSECGFRYTLEELLT